MIKCYICKEAESQYRCPKCSIRYCSLKCYKSESHVHKEDNAEEDNASISENNGRQENIMNGTGNEIKLKTYQYMADDRRIRELLQHNTVKFHLDKVHKILISNAGGGGPGDGPMTQETKRELAIDYLNTLRTGGIHCNEAIEEFCQTFLEILHQAPDTQ